MRRRTSWKRAPALIALATALMLVAGCSGGGDPVPEESSPESGEPGAGGENATGDEVRELVIWAGSTSRLEANFNPYSPAALTGARGAVFEPLFAYNRAADTERLPMLATDAQFNEDGSEMTVTIRQGVKWNDGVDFTADDVAFSLMHELSRPEYLESAEKVDERTVLLTFDAPRFTQEAAILQQVIIPEHVWADLGERGTHIGDDGAPAFLNDVAPVGTGPFMLAGVTETDYTMTANENYWQPGKPHLERLKYLAVDEHVAEELLRQGELDWAGMFLPDPEHVTGEGGVSMINTPQDPAVIYTCANADLGCEGPQTDKSVRQAIHLAIDRTAIIDTAFFARAGASNPAFTLPGRDDEWVAEGIPSRNPPRADAAAAKKVLEGAGYELNSGGVYEKDGVALEMTLASVEGWTDYNKAAALIEEHAADAGMKLTAATITWEEFAEHRDTGEFELIIGGVLGTQLADPYQVYAEWFGGEATNPVGEPLEPGTWNFARYAHREVDEAIKMAAATLDTEEKRAAYGIIQRHIVEDLPYIPLLTTPTMTFYNSAEFTGWPTEEDPYMFPPPWEPISAGVILGNLEPTG